MADFRTVKCAMWREDEWFQSLTPDERLLFIYLFTNPSASVAGIYKLPLRTISFESGLALDRCKAIIARFTKDNKAYYEDGVVWVRRMREHQLPGNISNQVAIRLARDVEAIPDCPLKTRYLQAYGAKTGVQIPYEYPTDTVSIPFATDTDTDTDTDRGVSSGKERVVAPPSAGAQAPAPKPPKKSPKTPPPPEIETIRAITGRYPDKVLWPQIVATVSSSGKDSEYIGSLYTTWRSRGYSPTNYAWLLEWLPNGIPTTNGKGKAAKLPSGLPAPEHLWGVVQAEIDRVHSYGTPALPDQIMTAIQAVGGWYLVCKCDPEGNIPARLRDAYRSVING